MYRGVARTVGMTVIPVEDDIKAQFETGFCNGISSVLRKSFQLALYNEFGGSPGFIAQDIENSLAVTSEDIWRVYNSYIKDKPFVLTSFVPMGHAEMAAEGSTLFEIPEDPAGLESAAAGMKRARRITTRRKNARSVTSRPRRRNTVRV